MHNEIIGGQKRDVTELTGYIKAIEKQQEQLKEIAMIFNLRETSIYRLHTQAPRGFKMELRRNNSESCLINGGFIPISAN